jgi:glucoamylase
MGSPFRLRWTIDNWAAQQDSDSHPTTIGAEYVDVPTPSDKPSQIEFTFYWPQSQSWEGKNFQVQAQ